MRKYFFVIFLLLGGCSDDFSHFFKNESDAVRLLIAASKGEDRAVWNYLAKEAIDQTLTGEEKEKAYLEFKKKGVKSLPGNFLDIFKIIEKKPKFSDVGQKTEGDAIFYAVIATYPDDGYYLDNGDVARKIKIIVEKNSKAAIFTKVSIESVLEIDVEATERNKKNISQALYSDYVEDKIKNNRNIKKILAMYEDGTTPVAELNSELRIVNDHILNKRFDNLIKVTEVGGYSERGDQLNMSEGYGTVLSKYVKIENLTNIPLRISHTFDVQEYYNYKDGEKCGGWFLYSCTPIYRSGYSDILNGEHSSLLLNSKETDFASKNYRQIKYYNGYRVSQQFNDGTWTYNWDDSKSLKVKNYVTTEISIWSD